MADLPKINKTVCLPVGIAVFPYLLDHRFEGNAVFPAVEAMQVLAQSVKEFAPQTDITAITDISFDKFLFIPPNTKQIDTLCNITLFEAGDITAVLQTKTTSKKAAITRTKAHVTVNYSNIKQKAALYHQSPLSFEGNDGLEISPDQIYRELVPFGPAYQNISKNLFLHKDGAIAKIQAPIISDFMDKTGRLGSPFVLDAAFHAACVWGQRYSGVVAFPVGVEKRIIVNPTQPGETYISTAVPVRRELDRLIFDICIHTENYATHEKVLGVHMRDVSAGRMRPPSWIIKTRKENLV
jgi:Polyketide synthase dehydratase N-terminal domain